MIYHDEIHFTTLYIAELGTRAEPLDEGARAKKSEGKERQLKPLRRGECMQHVCTAYIFFKLFTTFASVLYRIYKPLAFGSSLYIRYNTAAHVVNITYSLSEGLKFVYL